MINKEKKATYMRSWRADNRDRAREISRAGNEKWTRLNPERKQQTHQSYNERIRQWILDFFGGKCVHCGIDDPRVLQIDHINGDGHKYRQDVGWSLQKRYNYVKKNQETARLVMQLLCANCNWIKRVENKEYRRTTKATH
jgi:hypothetical protein